MGLNWPSALDTLRTQSVTTAPEVKCKLDEVSAAANVQGSIVMNDAALDTTLAKLQRVLATAQQIGSATAAAPVRRRSRSRRRRGRLR